MQAALDDPDLMFVDVNIHGGGPGTHVSAGEVAFTSLS